MKWLRHAPPLRSLQLAALGVLFLVSAVLLVAYTALVPSEQVTLAVGQVASQDIRAPISLTYVSDVLTALARQDAARAVRNIYDPPNFTVLRQQLALARNILNYIDNIRHDSFASKVQRVSDLEAIDTLSLDSMVYNAILSLSDEDWREVDGQVILLLERTMRSPIREDNLQDMGATLPNMVSVNVTDLQADLIVALVRQMLRPNAFFNEQRTQESRQAAADAVRPVTRSFLQGQVVVRAGTIVTEADMEALAQLRLLQPTDQRARVVIGAALVIVLVSILIVIYLRRFYPDLLEDAPRVVFVGGLFLLFLAGTRMLDVSQSLIAHVYPAAAFTLIVVAVTNSSVGLALTFALGVLMAVVAGNSLEVAVLVALTGIAGVLTLNRTERLNGYFLAGLTIGVVNIVIGLVFLLVRNTNLDAGQILALFAAGLLSGVLAAGLGLVGLYVSSSVLNLPTTIKLLELSQPSQPLLQRLLREAPGTYQHSLQVANLAELAAERIGANAPLVRVGALYHDIGKLTAPPFFAENQADGMNPHEAFNPYQSARIIISHVTEGEKLARKNRLPRALIDFILQHHGTTQAMYFYTKAIEIAGDIERVDRKAFTYPGPRPQDREAAVLMLADTSESVVRAKRTRDKQEIAVIVAEIIQNRLAEGQLDDSHLTVNDLRVIQEVFVSSLQGVFHPRIAYPARSTQEMQAVIVPQSSLLPPERSTPALPPATSASGET